MKPLFFRDRLPSQITQLIRDPLSTRQIILYEHVFKHLSTKTNRELQKQGNQYKNVRIECMEVGGVEFRSSEVTESLGFVLGPSDLNP